MRSGARGGWNRCTSRHGAWHQVLLVRAGDAVHSVIDRSVKNGETAGRNWRHGITGSNRIECCVVPLGNNIGIGGNSGAQAKTNDANARYEKRTSDQPTHRQPSLGKSTDPSCRVSRAIFSTWPSLFFRSARISSPKWLAKK